METLSKEKVAKGYIFRILRPMDPLELRECVDSHPKNQSQIADDIGVTRATIGRWIKGERNISEPDSKLLRLYFYGEMPFEMLADATARSNQLRFTQSEWQIISILSKREGYHSPVDWITGKIRGYLDNNPTAQELSGRKLPYTLPDPKPSKVAEDEQTYNREKPPTA